MWTSIRVRRPYWRRLPWTSSRVAANYCAYDWLGTKGMTRRGPVRGERATEDVPPGATTLPETEMATIVGFDQAASDFTVTENRFPLVPVGSVWLLSDAVMPGAPHLSNCPMPDRKRKRRRTRRGGRNAPPGLGVRGRSSPCPQAAMRPCGYVGLEGRRGIRRSPQGNVDDGPRSWSGDYKKHTESFLELSVDYIWDTPVSRLTTWGDVAY